MLTLKLGLGDTRPQQPINCFQEKLAAPQPNANVLQPPVAARHHDAWIRQYPSDLTLIPSTYWPHCQGRDHLKLWKPAVARPQHDSLASTLSVKDLAQIEQTITHAWADTTKEMYGTGLLAYHAFCDSRKILDLQWAPASAILISFFISNLAGLYSRSTMTNYVQGVQAWHTIHGLNWVVKDVEVDALPKAVSVLAPLMSKHKPREPFTVEMIVYICRQLDLNIPLHAAVFACLTTTFYATTCLGEFTISQLDAFNPNVHVKPLDVRKDTDRHGRQTINFHLPWIKATPQEEDIYWARQEGPSDPDDAFNNHLHINDLPPDTSLFAYRDGPRRTPKLLVTRTKFLLTISLAAKAAGIKPLSGHSIHISSTLKYLLHNLPFKVVKTKGQWASDAFLIYLCQHAQILAPYMQASPEIHETFMRFTLPLVWSHAA